MGSCGAEVEGGTDDGTLAFDLRLEPNPRPLKREFIELIRTRARKANGRGERRMIRRRCRGCLCQLTSNKVR